VPFALSVRIFWRLDEAHTPRTASGSFGLVTSRWSLVNWRSGTRMAIEFVLNPLTPSTPGSAGSEAAWRVLNGRSPARSKIEPRSTKNASSRWPAKSRVPFDNFRTARAGERRVVGGRPRADVGRGHANVPGDLVTVAPDVVGLPDEQVRVVQARDRAVVVEERRDPAKFLALRWVLNRNWYLMLALPLPLLSMLIS
jgi:hypothetical protein